jgi:hypothetical protein
MTRKKATGGKRASKASTRSPKRPRKSHVSRYEYAQLCMQLGTLQAQVARNRSDLEIQLRRIAQLQDELDTIKKGLATTSFPGDSVVITLPKIIAES